MTTPNEEEQVIEPTGEDLDNEFGDGEQLGDRDTEELGEREERAPAPEKPAGEEEDAPTREKPAGEEAEPGSKSALEAAEAAAAKKQEEADRKTVAEAARKMREAEEAAGGAAEQTLTDYSRSLGEHLKDVTIRDQDDDGNETTTTIGNLAENFPAVFDTAVAVAEAIVSQRLGPLAEQIQTREAEAARESLFDALASDQYGHGDAREIAESREFQEWAGKQSAAVQALAESPDPADAAMVLSAYKEATGKAGKATPAADSEKARKQRAEKERRDNLHRSTTRTRQQPTPSEGDEPTAEELDRDFEEESALDD
jgi:hypothetical protein